MAEFDMEKYVSYVLEQDIDMFATSNKQKTNRIR